MENWWGRIVKYFVNVLIFFQKINKYPSVSTYLDNFFYVSMLYLELIELKSNFNRIKNSTR